MDKKQTNTMQNVQAPARALLGMSEKGTDKQNQQRTKYCLTRSTLLLQAGETSLH